MPSVKSAMAVFETNPTAMRQKRASYSGPPGKTPTHEPKENPFHVQLRSVKREQPQPHVSQPAWDAPDLNIVLPDLTQAGRKHSVTDNRRSSITDGPSSRKTSIADADAKHPFRKDPTRKESDTRPPFRRESETQHPFRKESVPEKAHPFRKESVPEKSHPFRKESVPEKGHPFRKESVPETKQPLKKETVPESTQEKKPSKKESVPEAQKSVKKESVGETKQPSKKESVAESKQPLKKVSKDSAGEKNEPIKKEEASPLIKKDTEARHPFKKQAAVSEASQPPVKKDVQEAPSKQPAVGADKVPSIQNGLPPAPPPPPPGPPAPPPLPGKKPPSHKKTQLVEKLRQRPRGRPDWCVLLKEIETGVRLTKVQTNDRSKPIIPTAKGKTGFVYQSEKPNLRNQLLQEIQRGVKLNKCKDIKDRSKPNLEGLRKLRRQLTVEEQQKQAIEEEPVSSGDELDDIDKIRDSLQATKQLLEEEVTNKNSLKTENELLRKEVEKLRKQSRKEEPKERKTESKEEVKSEEQEDTIKETKVVPQEEVPVCNGLNEDLNPILRQKSALNLDELDALEEEYKIMKEQITQNKKEKDLMDEKLKKMSEELALAKAQLENTEHKSFLLGQKLQKAGEETGIDFPEVSNSGMQTDFTESTSKSELKPKPKVEEPKQELSSSSSEEIEIEEEEEVEETESEEEIPIMKDRSIEKEVSLLETRLRNALEKVKSATLEKQSLKKQIRKLGKELLNEKKRFKKLKQEVKDVEKMMEGSDDEDDEKPKEDDDTKEEEEEEEEVTESPEESESEEESEDSEYEARGSFEERKKTLTAKIKTAEERLQVRKKANYRFKAHSDRLFETLKKDRDNYKKLEEDLNNVLAELG